MKQKCVKFFWQKFRERSKIWLEHRWIFDGFLKMKFILYRAFSRNFGESFDKIWRKTAFSWELGGLNCWLVTSCLQGDRRQVSPQFRCGSVRTGRRRWARTTVKSETPHVNVQSPPSEFWWSLRRSDVFCQASVSYQEFPHTIQHRAPRKFFLWTWRKLG